MFKSKDVTTRHEIADSVDDAHVEFEEKAEGMDDIASDLETIRETIEGLNLAGTVEGTTEVEDAIDGAEDNTVEEFEAEDHELDESQEQSEEFEDDLQERSTQTESDAADISDAAAGIQLESAIKELSEAKEAALGDVEFLSEQAAHIQESRDRSERIQAEHRERIRAARRH